MRLKFIMVAVLSLLFFSVIHSIATEKAINKAPVAVLPEPTFKFEPVVEGTQIQHDFILQNKGTAPLVIKNVRTG